MVMSTPDGRLSFLSSSTVWAVGKAGVEKRVDVVAMAIQKQGTVFDLEGVP